MAHLTFWRQQLVLHLRARQRQEGPTTPDDVEQLNPLVFQRHRHRPWADILCESDQGYAELLTLSAQPREEELLASNRCAWLPAGEPLVLAFMGYCYEHTQQHLAQYLLDRHDPVRALDLYEVWANKIIQAEVPAALKGSATYNLACFYALHDRLAQAAVCLQQAFLLSPLTRELALRDPDLLALRPFVSG